jgi:hypothetical protein
VSDRSRTGPQDTEFDRLFKEVVRDVRRLRAGSALKGQPRVSSLRLGDLVLTAHHTGQGDQVELRAQNALTGGDPVVIATID